MKLFRVMETAFDNFDNTVRNYLSKTLNNLGIQYSHSQIFGVIFDGIKGIMQNMMFYIEDALTEQNIFTATRKKSVYSLAKVSGYEAYYGSAATGTILGKIHINNLLQYKTTKVFVKNYSKIMDKVSGNIYTLMLPTDYYVFDVAKPLITHEFKVAQGSIIFNSYVARGKSMETINIISPDLYDIQYIKVKIDGEEWQRCYNFYDMTENGKEYLIRIGYDNSFDIIFGNDIYGKKLEEGQTINIEFLKHSGVSGNIYPSSAYDIMFLDYGYDSLGNNVNINDYMNLSINSCISGGVNSDSISFIRNTIGSNSRSLVIASEENFKLFFKRFSFIGYINCWCQTNSMIVSVTCLRNYSDKIKSIEDYFKLSKNDMLLTNEQKIMIKNTLNNSNKTFAGITLDFKDPILRNFAIICYVKIDDVYEKDTVRLKITDLLASYFINIESGTLFISKSELVKLLLDNIPELKSVSLDIISETAEQAYRDGYYEEIKLTYLNGNYSYKKTKIIYEPDNKACLDMYNNISLSSKLEIPILQGGFKYYTNKEIINDSIYNISKKDITSSIIIDPIQVYFM